MFNIDHILILYELAGEEYKNIHESNVGIGITMPTTQSTEEYRETKNKTPRSKVSLDYDEMKRIISKIRGKNPDILYI
ncbi:hypothetical protein HY448_00035 [Candidatus Pacearchaeota archaeon]|nr:hypothetical protein [Candidatus Pacearchaeota archaeon]